MVEAAANNVKSPEASSPGREVTEEEFWRREWDKQEDMNAIVDVDVRGWIYTPHQGQMTRKHRLLIGLARQLSGVPAPPSSRPDESGASSRASSPSGSFRVSQQEEDLITFEADNIVRKGLQEERYADRGAFSERPNQSTDTESVYGNDSSERGRQGRQRASYPSTISSQDSDTGTITPIQKQTSWQQTGKMSNAELIVANKHLLNRLKPFMANPLAKTAISAFFYNAEMSRQLTVFTDAYGHFTVRAALDFIPTHVRVLAAEKLSATEEVIVTAPKGVSLISDIDDTVKHSAISAGAREIFRNAFIRELGDLTIEGVREWYTTLHDMGVKMHYVSNAPWQMYPVLTSYFKLAKLPKGSFHLKQYNGMLQGIFEPVAERKKSSLNKLMRDFPERKFVFVGDSGEADLEVYTDTALDNPGRVLGIFIRDVTTTVKTGYFDSNNSPGSGSKSHSREHSRNSNGDALAMSKRLSRPNDIRNDDADLQAAVAASLADMEEEARRARRSINPDAPAPEAPWMLRVPSRTPGMNNDAALSSEEDLIDFSEPTPSKPWLQAPLGKPSPSRRDVHSAQKPAPSPPPPLKPAALRSPPSDNAGKVPPPVPRKPSITVQPSAQPPPQAPTHHPSPLSQVTRQDSTRKAAPPLPARPPRTYREMAKDTLTKARPAAGNSWQSEAALGQSRPRTNVGGNSQPTSPLSRPAGSFRSVEDLRLPEASFGRSMAPPPPPPRRNMTSTTSRQATQRNSGGWDDNDFAPTSPGEGMSKKEFLWKQRWERAKDLLERKGVTLRTWRTGSDVADVCVRLVEMELRKIEKESRQ